MSARDIVKLGFADAKLMAYEKSIKMSTYHRILYLGLDPIPDALDTLYGMLQKAYYQGKKDKAKEIKILLGITEGTY